MPISPGLQNLPRLHRHLFVQDDDVTFLALTFTSPMSKDKHIPAKVLYICTGEKCKKRGSKELSKQLREYAKDHRMDNVGIIRTHCTDNCKHGPVVCLHPGSEWHFHVDEQKGIGLLKKLSQADEGLK